MKGNRTLIPAKICVGLYPDTTAQIVDDGQRNHVKKLISRAKSHFTLDNTGISGFELLDHGDMGYFVRDPRGFSVWVHEEWGFSVIKNSTIINGKIIDKCV
jgi:hypothetical protein